MKDCVECDEGRWSFFELSYAKFFGKRVRCYACEFEYEISNVSVSFSIMLKILYSFVFMLAVGLVFQYLNFWYIGFIIMGWLIIYFLEVALSPLRSVGLRAAIKQQTQ